jgi:hypothetical protein
MISKADASFIDSRSRRVGLESTTLLPPAGPAAARNYQVLQIVKNIEWSHESDVMERILDFLRGERFPGR